MLHARFPNSLLPAARRVALLIDADNVPRDKLPAIVDAATRHGMADVRRAYGDWAGGCLKGWRETLLDHAVRPVQQFAYTTGKNASDIALVIDAMELLHTCPLDGFCIVSSDADFTPLALHLRATGREVHGFGEAKTPQPFVSACTSFIDIGGLPSSVLEPVPAVTAPTSQPAPIPASAARPLACDTSLVVLLRAAVEAAAAADGWTPLSAAGSHARKAGVDPKAHGCRNFTALYTAMKLFEVERTGTGDVRLRDRRRAAGRAHVVTKQD